MKGRGRGPWWLAGLASLMLVAGAATTGWSEETTDDPGAGDRAIGVIGAAICGGEMWLIQTNPLIGMNPYVLAAGIGGCLLMGLDMIT